MTAMAAKQDGRGKLVETAVEKILLTDLPKSQRHILAQYFWGDKLQI